MRLDLDPTYAVMKDDPLDRVSFTPSSFKPGAAFKSSAVTPPPRSILGMEAVIVSRQMTELMEMVERVARSNASVLITGESGSGKELIARALHQGSMRASKAWVDVELRSPPRTSDEEARHIPAR